MPFAPDVQSALVSLVWLANSVEDPDALQTTEQLAAFYRDHRYTGRLAGSRLELDDVRAMRPAFRELLLASRDDAATIVNAMLREASALPRLVRHDDVDWHLHAVDDDQPFAVRIAVESAMAMVEVIRADEMSRLGVCADAGCHGVVLDLSRNRSRIFCSTACGNRAAVAAYRARQA